MRSLMRILLLAAILGPTASGADPFASLEARLSRLERENEFLKSQLSRPQTTIVQNSQSPAFLGTDKHNGLTAGIEYLHWAYRQSGTEYAILADAPQLQNTGPQGRVLELEGDYDSGLRASLGYRFDAESGSLFNRPEFLIRYTNFGTEALETTNAVGRIRSTFITSQNNENDDDEDAINDASPEDLADSATASHDFDYEVLDAEIAQSFALTRTMNLRLSAIGRFAMIDDEFRVTYAGGDFANPFTAFRNWDYQGGGLLLGSQLDWALTERLGLQFSGRAGMLMGRQEFQYFNPDDDRVSGTTDVVYNTTKVTPIIEMTAMVNYTRDFGRFDLNVGGGYEFSNWFNMAEDRVFSDAYQEGQNNKHVRDLTLDGLVGRVSINY